MSIFSHLSLLSCMCSTNMLFKSIKLLFEVLITSFSVPSVTTTEPYFDVVVWKILSSYCYVCVFCGYERLGYPHNCCVTGRVTLTLDVAAAIRPVRPLTRLATHYGDLRNSAVPL